LAAGATEAGVHSLRSGLALADLASVERFRITSRLALAEALIHSLRGQDEEGIATRHVADEIAMTIAEPGLVAEARAEIGYVDFLRVRPIRIVAHRCSQSRQGFFVDRCQS
jgi:hypothetical protein